MKANLQRKSFVLLLILLLLLFAPSIVEAFGGPSPSPTLNSAFGFALTLIGIFVGAYFELARLQQQSREKIQEEIRQNKVEILKTIETWLDGVAQTVEDIAALRELSPKDKSDGVIIVSKEQTKPIQEKLLRLDYQWLTIFVKSTDVIGIKKGETKFADLEQEKQSLIVNLALIGSMLTTVRETFSKGDIIPGIEPFAHPIADSKGALDKLRRSIE